MSKVCGAIRNCVLPWISMRQSKAMAIARFIWRNLWKPQLTTWRKVSHAWHWYFIFIRVGIHSRFDKKSSERFYSMVCHQSNFWSLKNWVSHLILLPQDKTANTTLLFFVNTNMNISLETLWPLISDLSSFIGREIWILDHFTSNQYFVSRIEMDQNLDFPSHTEELPENLTPTPGEWLHHTLGI